MNVAATPTRRTLTVIAVVASLIVGFGAIRASAAWTAAAAPLTVAPVTADALQARLAEESVRSAALLDRLTSLTTHADELAAALAAAQARIDADATHAAELAKDLATARQKLAALEKSIRQATRTSTVAVAPAAARPAAGTSGGDDDGGGDD